MGNTAVTLQKSVNRHTLLPAFLILASLCIAAVLYHYNGYAFFPFLFGFLFGYTMQRSRFCFAACFRDIFLIRNTTLTRALLIALTLTTAGFAFVNLVRVSTGLDISGRMYPLGVHTALGGFLFGLGMVIAGSCVSGCMVRMGEGYLMQYSTFAGLVLGSLLGAWNLNWWLQGSASVAPVVFLPDHLGWPGALGLQFTVLAALYLLAMKYEGVKDPLAVFRFTDKTKKIWPYGLGAVLLALGNTGLFALHGKPWGITSGITYASGWAVSKLGVGVTSWEYFRTGLFAEQPAAAALLAHPLIYLALAMVLGSLFSSLLHHEFRIRRARAAKYYYSALAGGTLMGYGSRLSFGCNIGALLSGTASLSLHGWLFGFSALAGAAVGGRVLLRYLLD
ncbi:MAG: YeeE/YedE family protein [Bacillota bacterium]|nr:YeeE/YedE family protein [Bacillota bacterium]MDW7684039.1 YeeE/YedE family protein [Bacillota bacterium]